MTFSGASLYAAFAGAAVLLALPLFAGAQSSYTFLVNEHEGDTSINVLELQIYLNTHGFPLASSGPGSPGQEVEYFGARTLLALERFQAAHGLPATGFFGPQTRAVINAVLQVPTAAATTSEADATTTPAWLSFFDSHAPSPGWVPGFGGGGGGPVAPQVLDTTPPTVSLTSPTTNTYLVGTVALTASASDNTSVAHVQFRVDDVNVGSQVTSAPYIINWDSTSVSDGAHSITVIATDGAGNVSITPATSVSTLNSPVVFSDISVSGGYGTDAIITWTTNQISTSEVVYGPTDSYGSEVSYGPNTTSHSLDIGVLTPGEYHYEVISTNLAGTTATSTDNAIIILSIVNPSA